MEIFLFVIAVLALIALIISLVLNYTRASAALQGGRRKAMTQEELYNGIVNFVATGEYQQACNLWRENEASQQYTLEYRDLADQYNYALALNGYLGAREVCLGDVRAALERVSRNFSRSNLYRKEVKALCDTICGVYLKEGIASAEYRIDIDAYGTVSVQYNQPSNYITVNYIKGEKAYWIIENGSIVEGRVSSGPYFLSMKPMVGGMEVGDIRQFGNDLDLCGVYIRQEALQSDARPEAAGGSAVPEPGSLLADIKKDSSEPIQTPSGRV